MGGRLEAAGQGRPQHGNQSGPAVKEWGFSLKTVSFVKQKQEK